MCNYAAPKQFAYVDPQGKFRRLGMPIRNNHQLESCRSRLYHKAEYISVYGWTGWKGGMMNAEISKTALIEGIFLDFDDAANPLAAIRDAAEVAWYVGHCTCNFSGSKGAHVLIHCYPVDLIPDLKSSVLRGFANRLADHLPELSTMDWAVIGDTSRVHRIIDSVHPGTKLHAIGLTDYELATLTIDEIHEMAANPRGLGQVPEPSQWVTDELYRIEGEILENRLDRLYHNEQLSSTGYHYAIRWMLTRTQDRVEQYAQIKALEEEWRRIRTEQHIDLRGEILGSTREETWLIHEILKFKAAGRAATGNRTSEHKARVHLAKLADECGWTVGEICDIYTGADDYDRVITERMVLSCIGRR